MSILVLCIYFWSTLKIIPRLKNIFSTIAKHENIKEHPWISMKTVQCKYSQKSPYKHKQKSGMFNFSWVFTQSRGILGLIHIISCMKKYIEVKKSHSGWIVPAFFWRSSKMVKFGVKTPNMVIFSIFQLWELETLIFSSPLPFWIMPRPCIFL